MALDRLEPHLAPRRGPHDQRAARRARGRARARAAHDPGLGSAATGGSTCRTTSASRGSRRRHTAASRGLLPSRWPQSDPTVFAGTGVRAAALARRRARPSSPRRSTGAAVHRARVAGAGPGRGLRPRGPRQQGRGHGLRRARAQGLPAGPVRAMVLSSFFAVDPVMFAAPASGGVYRSSDGGATWTAVGARRRRWWATSCGSGPFLYAAAEHGFYRSQDAGASWTRLSASPGRPSRLMFPLAPAAGLEAFLATDRGLFRTATPASTGTPRGSSDRRS